MAKTKTTVKKQVGTKLTTTINPYVEPQNAKFVKTFAKKNGFTYSQVVNGLISRQRTGKPVTINGATGNTFTVR